MQPASPAMPGFASSPALDLHARSAGATCLRTGVVSMRSKRSSKKAGRPRPNSGRSRDGDPARIQVNSTTLSLREQLKLVQGRNEAQAPRHRVERTRYRKRKPDADMYQSMGGPRGPDAEIPDGKYELSEQPVLYIDGYNIIGAWPRLRKQRDRGDLENARRLLVDDVTEFSHMRGWTCVVVFDACGNDNPVHVSTTEHAVDVVFTGSDTADSFIERAVYLDCERGKRQVWTATNDSALGTFSASKGAHRLSAALFIQEMKYAKSDSQERVESDAQEGRMRAKMLISSVDSSTRDALYKLREQLDAR